MKANAHCGVCAQAINSRSKAKAPAPVLVEAGMGQAAPAVRQEDGSWCVSGVLSFILCMFNQAFLLGGWVRAKQRQALLTRAPGIVLQES